MLNPAPGFERLSRAILGWLDERTDAPIMRQRVNESSDEYFRHAGQHPGESDVGELFDDLGEDNGDDADDDAAPLPHGPARALILCERDYAAAMSITVKSAVVLVVTLFALPALSGYAQHRVTWWQGVMKNALPIGAVCVFTLFSAVRALRARARLVSLRAAAAPTA